MVFNINLYHIPSSTSVLYNINCNFYLHYQHLFYLLENIGGGLGPVIGSITAVIAVVSLIVAVVCYMLWWTKRLKTKVISLSEYM